MHILYLYQYFTTREGIGHTRAYEFARRFVARGHTVTVITSGGADMPSREPQYDVIDGVNVVRLPVGYSDYIAGTYKSYASRIRAFISFSLSSAWYSLRAKSLRGVDVLYVSSPPLTVALPGWLLATLKGVPLVFEVRDCWPEAPIQMGALKNRMLIALARTFERLVYWRAAHIVALSPGMRDQIVSSTKTPEQKITVVPNSCDLDLFYPDMPVAEALSAQFEGMFVCLYFGAMGAANGLDAVLESAARLKSKTERVLIVLHGDGKERPALEAKAKALKLDNVRFSGPSKKAEVAELVAAADVCLTHFKDVPILYTCSPNKLFDALAAGKPVIVNTPGWTKALLEENEAGFYADATHPEALAALLERLASEPETVERYGQNARALAETRFSREHHTDMLLEVLTRVTGQR